jgi:hypothetical protein
MKAMGVYEVAALLISVFWFVGCGVSVRPIASAHASTTLRAAAANRVSVEMREIRGGGEI